MTRITDWIIVAVSVFGVCASHCPNGWMYFQGSCYLFSHDGKTYTEAEHFCNQHQAHLVKIDNKIEDTFLKGVSLQLKDVNRWIGLTDSDIEGIWQWTDGSSLDFLNWYPGDPNSGTSDNCACLYYPVQYGWVDEPCTHTYQAICEKPETGCESGTIVG